MSKGKSEVDLDAILEDVANAEKLSAPKPETEIDTSALKIRIVSEEYLKPWLAFSANCPKDFRDKWTKMVKADGETEIPTKFQASYAFRAWDAPQPAKNGINRALQELVKKSALNSGLDEHKINRLLTLVNPVTDSENGKQLQRAFAKQLMDDLANDIKTDPNFDTKRFPSLAAALSSSN
jgi:hypothetical protein